jgi:hypothetical protein
MSFAAAWDKLADTQLFQIVTLANPSIVRMLDTGVR